MKQMKPERRQRWEAARLARQSELFKAFEWLRGQSERNRYAWMLGKELVQLNQKLKRKEKL